MRRRSTSNQEDVAGAKAPSAGEVFVLGERCDTGTTPAPANNAGEEMTDSAMLKVLQQELRASMQQQQVAMHRQQAVQQELQASMQQLQMLVGNQMPILLATQTGLADVTVGLQGVAAEVQLMDSRMQKFEGNLTAIQPCTDDRVRKFNTQQRVTEAQIHGTVASVHDMKLQLQAEVALNIARTQKQQEDARALAALICIVFIGSPIETAVNLAGWSKSCRQKRSLGSCVATRNAWRSCSTQQGKPNDSCRTKPRSTANTTRRFLHAQQSLNGVSNGKQTNFEAMRSV